MKELIMPFDPDAQPWLNAKTLLVEYGEGALSEARNRCLQLTLKGRIEEAVVMLAVVRAVLVLGPSSDPSVRIH